MSPSSSQAGLGVWPHSKVALPPDPNLVPTGRRGRSASANSRATSTRATFIGDPLPAHDGSAYVDMMCRDLHQLRSGAIWHHPQERYILHDPSISVDTSFSGPP